MILVTGGCGYIGSHTVLVLILTGYDVLVIDSLVNSSLLSLQRVSKLSGKKISFEQGDIRDEMFLEKVFSKYSISAVIHFAGLKAVEESVRCPMEYYDVNVCGTAKLVRAMDYAGVSKIVFSSSATVYGTEAMIPYVETFKRGSTSSPYGSSKSIIEGMLEDQFAAKPFWSIALLRYFNPIGAHESGFIGEDPLGIPNNLMPFMSQVAVGRLEKLSVFGGDYLTPDGTCRRDYLHVMDLAEGHLKALEYLGDSCCEIFNLGTGVPVSVLEMINSFNKIIGFSIPYEIVERRVGDLPEFWADPSKANKELCWSAYRSLDQMISDAWNWQLQFPNGYE